MRYSKTCFALLLLILTGCTTPVSTAVYSPSNNGPRIQGNDLSVQLEIVSDEVKLKELFGTSHIGKGVLAVHLQIINTNPGKIFLCQPENFRLSTGGVSQIHVNTDAGQSLAVLAPLSMTIGIVGLAQHAKESVIRNNLIDKGFKSATLQGRNNEASGFLYLQVPDKLAIADVQLEVRVQESGSSEFTSHLLKLKE